MSPENLDVRPDSLAEESEEGDALSDTDLEPGAPALRVHAVSSRVLRRLGAISHLRWDADRIDPPESPYRDFQSLTEQLDAWQGIFTAVSGGHALVDEARDDGTPSPYQCSEAFAGSLPAQIEALRTANPDDPNVEALAVRYDGLLTRHNGVKGLTRADERRMGFSGEVPWTPAEQELRTGLPWGFQQERHNTDAA